MPGLSCAICTHEFRVDGVLRRRRGSGPLKHAAAQTGVFHNQEGFQLRTPDDAVWVPVNLSVSRLHVRPKTLVLVTARDMRAAREARRRLEEKEAELRRVLASVS